MTSPVAHPHSQGTSSSRTCRFRKLVLVAVLFCGASLGLVGCRGAPAPTLPPPPLEILTSVLPEGIVTLSYSANLFARGGRPPISWDIDTGSLPPGLELEASTGAITGTPEQVGRFDFTVRITDSAMPADSTTKALSIDIRDTASFVELISQASDGTQANGDSGSPALSADGRYVVFTSFGSNLIPGDTNNVPDVFIRDRLNQTTGRVSVPNPPDQATLGAEADAASFAPAISADGRFVAYTSAATNLLPEDMNAAQDIFVTELDLSGSTPVPVATRRISVGRNLPDTSADSASATTIGNSALTLTPDEHKDRLVVIVAGTGAGQVRWIASNDDTTLTLYESWDVTPDATSVFRIISLATRGINLPGTTADIASEDTIGNSTLMLTEDEHANQLVALIAGTGKGQVRRIAANTDTTLTVTSDWDPVPDTTSVFLVFTQAPLGSNLPFLSNDGQVVAFQSAATTLVADDTTLNTDIFVHTVATGETSRVSVRSDGSEQAGESQAPFLNADGQLVAFQSTAQLAAADTNLLRDIYLHDRNTATTTRVNLAPDGTSANTFTTISSLSASGRFILFQSFATNLVAGDSNGAADLFLHDRTTAETTLATLANDGSQADRSTEPLADISGAGRLVVFSSSATNLVAGDTNGLADIFVRDRQAGTTLRVSIALGGAQPNVPSTDPVISADGRVVAFSSSGTTFVVNDTNDARDVFAVTTGLTDAPLIILPQLTPARRAQPYSITPAAIGGERPLFWTLAEGQLPPGLTLDPRTGRISGLPVVAGTFRFTLLVWDNSRPRQRASQRVTLLVKP